MVRATFCKGFAVMFSKIKDKITKERIIKQIEKIKNTPEVGKPMRNTRKGTRELYIGSFRLSYAYSPTEDLLTFLDFYHKDEQ